MKQFVVILGLLFTMSTQAAITVTNVEFVFKLGGDWTKVPSSDPNQFSFESKSNKTSVVLSVLPINISEDKLVEVARKFAEVRQKAEEDARKGRKIEFGDKNPCVWEHDGVDDGYVSQ